MARVDPGELRYLIIIKNRVRSLDSNMHYIVMPELIHTRAGVMKNAGGCSWPCLGTLWTEGSLS